MKIYKHDRYNDKILLAYPYGDKFLGVPYFYSQIDKKWVRAGLGTALPYYSTEHLAQMEQIGDTETDWDFHIDNLGIDSSYLIKKGRRMMRKSKIRRTIEWCYENGKSFMYLGAIYNVDKLGADINLSAVACVDKNAIERVKHDKVYYFIRTKGAKND